MEPSNELNQAIEKIQKALVENLKQWTILFSKIPLYRWCESSIEELENKEINVDYGDPEETGGDHVLYVLLDLEKRVSPDDDDVVGCEFNTNNKARIDRVDQLDHDREYPELVAIGFFGFEGTWDEVASKMIEGSRLFIQKAPTVSI